MEIFQDDLCDLLPGYGYVIVCGDFNARFGSGSAETQIITEVLSRCSLTCIPYCPTYHKVSSESVLDVIATNCDNLVLSFGQTVAPAFSNHDLLFAALNIFSPKMPKRTVSLRDFRHFDYERFLSDAQKVPWENIYVINNIDDKVLAFNDLLISLYDMHTLPYRSITVKENSPPWLSHEIRKVIKKRDSARRKHLKTKLVADFEIFRSLRNKVKSLTRSAKSVDMVAALLPLSFTTMSVARPSIPLAETEFVVLMQRPRASANGSGLLAPFTTVVWLLILVSLIAVGPVMFLIIKLRNRLLCPPKPLLAPADPNEPIHEVYPMSACVWFVYGALMKQGSTLSPQSDSTRMLFATWWLFILVLTAYYTANLTAFLTLSKFTLPISSSKDIASKGYNWFADKGRLMETAVTEENDAVDALKKKNFRLDQHFFSLPFENETRADAILKYVKRDYLYLAERQQVEYLIFRQYVKRTKGKIKETERCELAITPQSFMVVTLGFFYPNQSVLPQLFEPVLMTIMESGIVKFRQKSILPLIPICPLDLKNNERQLRNQDLATTYYVIASGFAAGIIAFMSEVGFRRYKKKKGLERTARAQRKLLGSPMGSSAGSREDLVPSQKRVRLKIPLQPRYPGDLSHILVLPSDKGASKTQFIPDRSSPNYIFR